MRSKVEPQKYSLTFTKGSEHVGKDRQEKDQTRREGMEVGTGQYAAVLCKE